MQKEINYQINIRARWDDQNCQYYNSSAVIIHEVDNLTVIRNIQQSSQAKRFIHQLEQLMNIFRT